MIALYLLACHLVGDFVLQTRWQAGRKLLQAEYRLRHVAAYLTPFLVLTAALTLSEHLPLWRPAVFLVALGVAHYLTDHQRFPANLGDWLAFYGYWYLHWRDVIVQSPNFTQEQRDSGVRPPRPPLTANPWEPLPTVIDQTLHVCQLAALGWLLT